MNARAILCPHQPPTGGDNTVSVAQSGTATPGATKQLLPLGRVLRELYIYICQINKEQRLHRTLIFILSFSLSLSLYIYIYRHIHLSMSIFLSFRSLSLSARSLFHSLYIYIYIINLNRESKIFY